MTSVPLKRILVVDDDQPILQLVATILRRERYDVDTASGGRDALSKIDLTPYDVIVLDLMMPEVSGFDVLSTLSVRVPQVKCVVVLSAGSSFDIAKSINPNVFATLQKPFETTELIDAIRECIEAPCAAGHTLSLQPVAAVA